MADYVLLVITFAATVVSVFGDTWNNKKAGFAKLTPVGRVVLVVALGALAVSVYQTHTTNIWLQWQEAQRDRLRAVALHRVHDSLRSLLQPFHDLYVSTVFRFHDSEAQANLQKFEDDPNYMFTELTSQRFLRNAQQVRMLDPAEAIGPASTEPWTWSDYFANAKSGTDQAFDRLFARYGTYLDFESTALISAALDDEFYVSLESFVQHPQNVLPVETFSLGDSYVAFVSKVQALNQRVAP